MRLHLKFIYNRITEILWVKPLLVCLISIGMAFLARLTDYVGLDGVLPEISRQSIESLLQISASSMLVIATFAVGSMISAFASASGTATPRSFPLLVADDISQNALSVFIGAFIYSTVTLVAVQNNFYGIAGLATVFAVTAFVFAIVIVTFVRWMDRIARLGRLGHTVDKVESATNAAILERKRFPTFGAQVSNGNEDLPKQIFLSEVGYLQRINIAALQKFAESLDCHIRVEALPGTFLTPNRPILSVADNIDDEAIDEFGLRDAFIIGGTRTFDEDPRFGLVVLSEIAGRALSPAVNDPGTAISVIGSLVRLMICWAAPLQTDDRADTTFDRVLVPVLDVEDLFDDAFSAIARDGAGAMEVGIRLQKAFSALSTYDLLNTAAMRHAETALARSREALTHPRDFEAIQEASPIKR